MATSAHCSVAVVPATQLSVQPRAGWVATLLDSSTDEYDVLQQAIEETQLRELPLRVVMPHRHSPNDTKGDRGKVEVSQPEAAIEESLVNWTRRYPGIDARIVHADQFLRYVAEHQGSIQSVVLGAAHHHEVAQLVELTRSRALHDANLSVLVVRGQHL